MNTNFENKAERDAYILKLLGVAPKVVQLAETAYVKTVSCEGHSESKQIEVPFKLYRREIRTMFVEDPDTKEVKDFSVLIQGPTNYCATFARHNGKVYVRLIDQFRPTQNNELGESVIRTAFPGGYNDPNGPKREEGINNELVISGEAGARQENEEETGIKIEKFNKTSKFYVDGVYDFRTGPDQNTLAVYYYDGKINLTPTRTGNPNNGTAIVTYWMPVEEVVELIQNDSNRFDTPGIVAWGMFFAAKVVKFEFVV